MILRRILLCGASIGILTVASPTYALFFDSSFPSTIYKVQPDGSETYVGATPSGLKTGLVIADDADWYMDPACDVLLHQVSKFAKEMKERRVHGISLRRCAPLLNARVVDDLISRLGDAGSLQRLNLLRVPMAPTSPARLKLLPGLRTLDLAYTAISDEDLKAVGSVARLETLNISYTSLSDKGLAYLKQAQEVSSTLKSLDVSSTSISNEGLLFLSELKGLERVRASKCGVNDAGVDYLARIKTLKEAALSFTNMTDQSLAALSSLPGLESLSVNSTRITDVGMLSVSRMSSLKVLNIGSTSVTDKGINAISALPQLDTLYLFETKISDEGLIDLAKFKQLKKLFLAPNDQLNPAAVGQLKKRLPETDVQF